MRRDAPSEAIFGDYGLFFLLDECQGRTFSRQSQREVRSCTLVAQVNSSVCSIVGNDDVQDGILQRYRIDHHSWRERGQQIELGLDSETGRDIRINRYACIQALRQFEGFRRPQNASFTT